MDAIQETLVDLLRRGFTLSFYPDGTMEAWGLVREVTTPLTSHLTIRKASTANPEIVFPV